MTYVQSSPTDQLQPKTSTNYYQKPGDVVAFQQPVLFDVASKKQTIVDGALFPNPYNNAQLGWKRDSSAFTFEYNQRGHQVYRVIEVDAATGKARTLIDEQSKTFIYYNRQAEGLSSGRTYPLGLAGRQGNRLDVAARRLGASVSLRPRHRPGEEPDHQGQLAGATSSIASTETSGRSTSTATAWTRARTRTSCSSSA